jgi:SAM-dependent methyltransferase
VETDRAEHWQTVHAAREETGTSWYEAAPAVSLALIERAGLPRAAAVIDVGGGTARLVDALLDRGHSDLSLLDLSAAALARVAERLARHPRAAAARLDWIAADVTAWRPTRAYALWHDRAAFHFLTDPAEQAAYARTLDAAVPAGHAVIATFAPDGPARCSGLPVARHDAASVLALLGDRWRLVAALRHEHRTPAGAVQPFHYGLYATVQPSGAA